MEKVESCDLSQGLHAVYVDGAISTCICLERIVTEIDSTWSSGWTAVNMIIKREVPLNA
jgi:hypothetical protein